MLLQHKWLRGARVSSVASTDRADGRALHVRMQRLAHLHAAH